jgi:pyruvate,orthophosphate dikinase
MTWVYPLDHPHDRSLAELTALVGGKAANLWVMRHELGLPVPPGIAITTEACRSYLRSGWPDGLDEEVRTGLAAVGAIVGRRFGDADPLLVSVRSGAPVSMPGMMDTILDVGLAPDGVAGLARASGDEAFARACRERLVAMFRSTVGQVPPDDPWQQLRLAIEAVFRSWNSDRAVAYRAREGISDESGTGVTIQAMVFGNRGPDSATGVAFTRNPATGEPGLYGDVLFEAQGEDVVAGTHPTLPLAALDERLPGAARELRAAADRLERHYADLCDIEFTIEAGRLWLLQVRIGKRTPRAALRIAADMARDPEFPLSREAAVRRVAAILAEPPRATAPIAADVPVLTRGLGASPGIASGEIVTSSEDAVRVADAGRPVILVRAETSPDDVHGMARAAGILTATGGLASHAAVVARGWGVPAVVGARDLEVRDGQVRVPGTTLRAGQVVTIDGDDGRVFAGSVDGVTAVVPEARELLGWAAELGIPIGAPAAPSAGASTRASGPTPASRAPATPDDCLQAIGVKGFAAPDAVARALLCDPASVEPILDRLVADGLATGSASGLKLTDAGRQRRAELTARERAQVGDGAATSALDAFVEIDRQVKAIVTDWQMLPGDGEPVLNDHSDRAYDAAVAARLEAVHDAAMAWIGELAAGWPRAGRYGVRLAEAIERLRDGDPRFVASPRVDSYHGIWFELHEALILLAGRSRADEVAAGRA